MDTGGPSREFWRMFFQEVDNHYFVGPKGKRTLQRNTPALEVSFCYLNYTNWLSNKIANNMKEHTLRISYTTANL